jgi:hypothetical protein
MRDEAVIVILGACTLGAVLVGVLIGTKLNASDAYENCITYHGKSSVEEARATCKQIIRGTK